MAESWSLLLWGLFILLATATVQNQRASCPQCPQHSSCVNGTFCTCQDGYTSESGDRFFTDPKEGCIDINECHDSDTCRKNEVCINRDGSYECSCYSSNYIIHAFLSFFKSCPDTSSSGGSDQISENIPGIFNDIYFSGNKSTIALSATNLLQNMEITALEGAFKFNNGVQTPDNFVVTDRRVIPDNNCSERIFTLKAGEDTMTIHCTEVVRKSTKGQSAVAFLSYSTLGNIINGSFFEEERHLQKMDSIFMNSRVVSGTTGRLQDSTLTSSAILTFQHLQVLCSVIAVGLHYLYLAAFTWMFLEGLHLFLTVRNLKVANYTSASQFKKRFMYLFGYGIPAVIVAVSAGTDPQGYGTVKHCWLTLKRGFIWSFVGPVIAIILFNFVFYLIILWILRERLSSLNKDVSTIQNTRTLTFKALAQFFILGCSWSLSFLLTDSIPEPAWSVIAYTFTIINSLQGVYIFLIYCVFNRQVQEEYKKWFKGMQKISETDSSDIVSARSTQSKVIEELEKSTEFTEMRKNT
uniref:Adhesion G protein-coupled receptor E4P isoform X5 n=1 Tax=Phascolarctos cinereus TaxID=38626 RepID=A0A6P5JN37_PHACI|nr:putative adhesion G protein-coupled receptor E4P isoform X5 [Phascolarctos cinereus]